MGFDPNLGFPHSGITQRVLPGLTGSSQPVQPGHLRSMHVCQPYEMTPLLSELPEFHPPPSPRTPVARRGQKPGTCDRSCALPRAGVTRGARRSQLLLSGPGARNAPRGAVRKRGSPRLFLPPPSSCPLGAQYDPVWPLPWPLLAFSAWRGAEPSSLAVADIQTITLSARAIKEMLNLGKVHGTDGLSLSPLSWGRGTDVSLGKRNSLMTYGCLPGE